MHRKILLIVFSVCLLLRGVCYGEHPYSSRMQDFVRNVYDDYGSQAFAEVYAAMYPRIAELVSEEEYVAFQQHHSAKLSLKLTDVAVGDVSENPRLPRTLRQMVAEDASLQVYGVDVKYRAHFVSGTQRTQRISKTVYVALVDAGTPQESLYLLWDPSAMEEEESKP